MKKKNQVIMIKQGEKLEDRKIPIRNTFLNSYIYIYVYIYTYTYTHR